MTLNFSIEYHTRWGETLALVAPDDKLYHMSYLSDGTWTLTIPNGSSAILKDYFYVVMEYGLWMRTEWDHHHRPAEDARKPILDKWIDCPIEGCPFPRKHSAEIFDRPGYRGAGTAIPVFSLRSDEGFGVGEFRDIPKFVDWMERTGQSVLQLLPINDTTRKGEWGDSYPYSPVSSFALHPIYIHLPEVGVKEDAAYKKLQKELNALPNVDYPRVIKLKIEYLRKAYKERGAKDLATPACKRFVKENAYWLDPYAEFCAKRDKVEADFYRWVQFHLDKQLSKAVKYAHEKGVYLKGDLPIGVGRDSVDAAVNPQLYNLDSSAGAPPDFFSVDGQNWGFPTYNWDAMAEDDYAWWKARLRTMAKYFDAYRIDHILGFFRIWEIPLPHKSGLLGHFNPALPYNRAEIDSLGLPILGLFIEDPRKPGWFHPLISPDTSGLQGWQKERFENLYTDFFYHRHNDFWADNAMRKLPKLLSCTGMLACGEDLGMVPDCVPSVMDHEKILTLEMQRMEKGRGWPYLSVVATSSHDMTSIRLWNGDDKTPEECRRIVKEHLDSVSMLAVFPLQDWLSMDASLRAADPKAERINDPADPNNKWCWRMHLTTTQLLESAEFCTRVAGMIKDSGR